MIFLVQDQELFIQMALFEVHKGVHYLKKPDLVKVDACNSLAEN